MNLAKKIYYTFLGLLGVIALLVIFSTFPIAGNYKIYTVLSGSMEPSIHTGSIVVVKPAESYAIGDVITFKGRVSGQKGEVPITHRVKDIIVKGGNSFFITQGDANNAPDTRELATSEIIGRMIFTVPYLGYAVEVARKPYGLLTLIILPAAIVIFDESRKIWREIKKRRGTGPADKTVAEANGRGSKIS